MQWAINAPIWAQSVKGLKVGPHGTDRNVGHKHGICKGSRQTWNTGFEEYLLIKNATWKDGRDWVPCAVRLEKSCRHEGQILSAPSIPIVNSQHDEAANDESYSLMDLVIEW